MKVPEANTFVIARVVVLLTCPFGFVSPALAQNFGMPDLLATLARGDISSISEDPYTYYAVSVVISALGYSGCALREPKLSLYQPYQAEMMSRMRRKTEGVGDGPGALAVMHPRYLEAAHLLDEFGCDSDVVQTVEESALRFALGRDPVDRSAAMPLLESESKQRDLAWDVVERYCSWPISLGGGENTAACARLTSFVNRGVSRRRHDGTIVPAIGEPIQIMTCVYGVITNSNTREGPRKFYHFWYERVPDDLSSYWVAGRGDPFRVRTVAITECPKDQDAAAELVSGPRSSQPPPSDPLPSASPTIANEGCVTADMSVSSEATARLTNNDCYDGGSLWWDGYRLYMPPGGATVTATLVADFVIRFDHVDHNGAFSAIYDIQPGVARSFTVSATETGWHHFNVVVAGEPVPSGRYTITFSENE